MPTPLPPTPSADVVARLNQLESETQTLRTEVEWLRENPVRLPGTSVTPTGMASNADISTSDPQAVQGDYFTLEELKGEMKKFAWTKGDFTITPYGILWPNMVYSTERTNSGTYTLYVLSASTGPEHEFIVDARTTRLGLDVSGAEDRVSQLCPERRPRGNRFPEPIALDGKQADDPAPPCLRRSEGRGFPALGRPDMGRYFAFDARRAQLRRWDGTPATSAIAGRSFAPSAI